MYNDKPCDTCDHYDPVLKGKQGKLVNTVWGWCAERSVYPHTEGPGQQFPAGVKRVAAPSDLAIPVIVKVGEVVAHCKTYKARKVKQSKAALLQVMKNV